MNAFRSIMAVVVLAVLGACNRGPPAPPPGAPSVSIMEIGLGPGPRGGLGVIAKGKNTSDRPLTVSITYALLDKSGVQVKSGVLFATGIGPQALFRIEEPISGAPSGAPDIEGVQITGIKAY